MNNLLHRDSDFEEATGNTATAHGDREITLGTTMILAIFFALAVFAAIFFGFGYSMGSRRNLAVPVAAAVPTGTNSSVGAAKPAAGSAASSGETHRSAQSARDSNAAVEPAPVASEAAPLKHAASPGTPALPAAAQPVVQIAAVSHQEDADLLVSTLKRRGYAVGIRSDARDKLLHVQVGPFATRQEAEAMRQRLVSDGFNAIVKDPAR